MRKTLATALLGAALIAAAGPAAATTLPEQHTVAATPTDPVQSVDVLSSTVDFISSEGIPYYLNLFDFVLGTIGLIVDHGSSNGQILPPCPYVPGGDPNC
ncbi:hypothetical protein [Aldersonia kunmingensis]|uniref:hypothetical protein n=1 Tax=Aldersonia kunmingensis TaxID=408066 RepID=UPI000833E1FA|nr:hypothetical protein [Aldersonia kunmingensis]